MKHNMRKVMIGLVNCALLTVAFSTHAQMLGGDSPATINASLVKLFGELPGFSAQADLKVLDAARKEWLSAPVSVAMLTNRIRMEMDMTQVQQHQQAAAGAETLKEMGMAQVVSISRPDQKLMFILFPDIKSCLEMPIDPQELQAMTQKTSLKKTALGKEKVGAYQCVKNKVVITSEKGTELEAVTWNAPELKDFPVRIEAKEQDKTSVLTFRDIKLAKPEAPRFDVPPGFTRYKDQQELMAALAKRALSNLGRGK